MSDQDKTNMSESSPSNYDEADCPIDLVDTDRPNRCRTLSTKAQDNYVDQVQNYHKKLDKVWSDVQIEIEKLNTCENVRYVLTRLFENLILNQLF